MAFAPILKRIELWMSPGMQGFEEELQIYNRQLEQGFGRLRFTSALEQEFRIFFNRHNVVRQRGAIIVGVILLLALLPLDMRYLSGEAQEYYLFSRVWITIPLLLVALALTFRQNLRRYFSDVSQLIIAIIGVTTSAVVVYCNLLDQPLPYEGIMLIMMVAFFLGGLYFRQALVCAMIIGLSYVAFSEVLLPAAKINYHNYFFLFATLLVGAVSAYTLEYQIRIAFLQRGALRNLAKTDPLTGLYNRGAISQKLNHLIYYAFREKKPITLLLIDVDHFKNFNDFYGHIQGDHCLQRVAAAISACCKRPLDFAGRYGGEEFVVMWFDAQPSEVEAFARRVKDAIGQMAIRHDASGTHSHVTVSGGMVTGVPTTQMQSDKVLDQADQCLYRAKESGRNRIVIQDLGSQSDISAIIK